MANIPKIRSKEQIIGDIADGIVARLGPGFDFNRGSIISQITEAMGQNIFKSNADIITMLDALSVDRAAGESLQRIANDKNVPILSAQAATGKVDITDTTFTKISTAVYSGQPAPVAGSLTLYVTDASKFTAGGGQIYLGRGTLNVEGPLTYLSAQAESGGAYWSITLAPTSPTTKFHNIGESVIMAQGGNRFIGTGTSIQTSRMSSVTSANFTTTADATIIDGEVLVTEVPVKSTLPGTSGNVPRGAIKEITGLPFTATVFNNLAFSNGRAADTEDDIRNRIKAYEQAKAKGTEQAIRLAAIGIVAQDELKKVQSSSVIRNSDKSASLVFDDGSGYEPNFLGAAFETVVDSAIGGEREVQIRQKPAAQARLKNITVGPYFIEDLSFLAVEIDGVETSHQFEIADFKVPSAASAFEVASSINGDPNIAFLCSTAEDGTKLVLYPRDRSSNNIKIKVPSYGSNANDSLGFPKAIEYTMRLYKNDQPLHQDGVVAKVSTLNKSSWSISIAPGETLTYQVDNTPAITATFTTADFQIIDQNAIVAANTSIDTWAAVMNNLMPGVTASVNGAQIDFTSNRGNSDTAKIEILGGSLKDKIFTPGATIFQTGRTPDYTFNKETGQVAFAEVLLPGDKITAGSEFTRANAFTNAIPSGTSSAGRVWMVVDGKSEFVPNSLKPNSQVSFSKTGTKLTISAQSPSFVAEGFDDVQAGDWLIVWANPTDPSPMVSNQGFWRVESAQVGELIVDDGTVVRSNLNSFVTPITDRIVIVRSAAPMQLFDYGILSLADFTDALRSQIVGINAEIVGSKVRISTKTFSDENGELFFAAVDSGANALGLTLQTANTNVPPHYGYVVSADSEVGLPSFVHGVLSTAITDSEFTEPNYLKHAGSEDDFVEILDKYDVSNTVSIIESNKNRRAFVKDYDQALNRLYLSLPNYLKTAASPIQADDRYFLRSSYKFDPKDTVSTILDGDSVTKAFTIPVARKLVVSSNSTPTTQDFSATDAESSLILNDPSSFYGFDFNDFKVLRQAAKVLTNGTYAIKVKAQDFGAVGNRTRVGIVYPKSIDQTEISHGYNISDAIGIDIVLPVKTPRTPNWDYTTSFTVSKATVGGKDTVTYTYRAGLEPDFTNTGADVHVGDIAIISPDANFLSGNRDIRGRVLSFTTDTFTIEIPTGKAIDDSVVFSNIVNQNGVITVTTSVPHNLITGQRVGMWNTATVDGFLYPFDVTYGVTVLNSTQFTVPAPVAAPGGPIQSATHISNVITVTTSAPHGLQPDNIILTSGVSVGSYDGIASVSAVLGPNQFQYIKSGASSPISALGRFDFQSFGASTVANISTIAKTGSLVTANTATAHGLVAGNIVKVQSVVIDAWSNIPAYNPGDIVRYSGQNYESLTVNTNKQPNVNPADWQATALDLTGSFIVNATPTSTQFTYYYSQTGSASGTSGTSTKYVPMGSMARSLGGATASNLQFGLCETTAQEIVDYVSVSMAEKLVAELANVAPTAVINKSTEDLDLGSNYIATSFLSFEVFKTSRKAIFRTGATLHKKGADLNVFGMAGAGIAYNNTYTILDAYYDTVLLQNVAVVQTGILAATDAVITDTASVLGSVPGLMLEDGENSVYSTDLGALVSQPMFVTKHLWNSAPAIGEELRLMVTNGDQIARFWNRLVVSGFSNLGKIELSQYGRDLQLSSQTFGNKGSVQVAGGTANKLELAMVGSGAELDNKFGLMYVPYEIRKGLVSNQWVNVYNTVRQNKILNFSANTDLKLWADGAEIISGTGTFQTLRATAHTSATKIKVERHGAFTAIISVGGPLFNLSTAGVSEGDWVKIRNINALVWNTLTVYTIGQRVHYNGQNYTSLQNGNTGNTPGSSPSFWQLQEFNQSNQGIFRVVRIFGQDSFWIEHSNSIEEIFVLGDAGNISFYSADSVMPGDTFIVGTDIFGSQNIGRYKVVDETVSPSYSFPTSTRIWTETIQNPPFGSLALSGDFSRINVEEAEPLNLWKRIAALGPASDSYEAIMLDSPNLMNRVSSSLGAAIIGKGKLEFDEDINFGVDAYKYYIGLIKELNKIIYGDASDPINYPGVRAGGTTIDIKGAIVKRIKTSLSIRVKSGVPFTEVGERVKAAVAGYINSLGVGESVSISSIVAAANTIPGVVSVAVTYPTYNSSNDLIPVGADEKALIVDATTDITISLIG